MRSAAVQVRPAAWIIGCCLIVREQHGAQYEHGKAAYEIGAAAEEYDEGAPFSDSFYFPPSPCASWSSLLFAVPDSHVFLPFLQVTTKSDLFPSVSTSRKPLTARLIHHENTHTTTNSSGEKASLRT